MRKIFYTEFTEKNRLLAAFSAHSLKKATCRSVTLNRIAGLGECGKARVTEIHRAEAGRRSWLYSLEDAALQSFNLHDPSTTQSTRAGQSESFDRHTGLQRKRDDRRN